MPPRIGDRAPDFSFTDATRPGHCRSLADFRGAAVIVAFAGAQRARQPVLQQLTFQGEPMVVLTPEDDAVAARYGVAARAALFVIGGNGVIVSRHVSGSDEPAWPTSPLPSGLSRREFMAAMLAAAMAAGLGKSAAAAVASVSASQEAEVAFELNGRSVRMVVDPRVTLLDALRERLGLTGSKKGCDHGQCGACTVHVGGRRVLSCLTLAATLNGKSITTIEGLARGDELHPMQQAFIEHDGFQCGYCTSGQIMSAVALLAEPCGPADDDVRECMSGNICRCGAYNGIVAAVQSARGARS